MAAPANTIKPMSNISTNQTVLALVRQQGLYGKKIIDIGAGRGYLIQELAKAIQNEGGEPENVLTACDFFPEYFEVDAIRCERLAFADKLPYPDNHFDTVTAVELIEHLASPYALMSEAHRILRPGGRFILTTPNILNLNSRLSFLLKGFYQLFGPLSSDPGALRHCAGHIMPLSAYYLAFGFRQAGFDPISFHYDRQKRSALFYYFLLSPLILFSTRRYQKRLREKHPSRFFENRAVLDTLNRREMLCSRSCIVMGSKKERIPITS